jgi:SWIM zinc finger
MILIISSLSVSSDDEEEDVNTTASPNTATTDTSKYITFSKYQQRKIKRFTIIKKKDHLGDSDYEVISGINKYSIYKSVNKGWLCTCRHFALFQTPCSHIKAVILHEQISHRDKKNTRNYPEL